jgi:predicted alpha/beta-fold hydrolase
MVKIRKPLKYEREIIKLSDGGTIALDWYIDESGGIPIKAQEYQKQCRKPILACVSGLSGGNNNLYLYSTIKEASQKGLQMRSHQLQRCFWCSSNFWKHLLGMHMERHSKNP